MLSARPRCWRRSVCTDPIYRCRWLVVLHGSADVGWLAERPRADQVYQGWQRVCSARHTLSAYVTRLMRTEGITQRTYQTMRSQCKCWWQARTVRRFKVNSAWLFVRVREIVLLLLCSLFPANIVMSFVAVIWHRLYTQLSAPSFEQTCETEREKTANIVLFLYIYIFRLKLANTLLDYGYSQFTSSLETGRSGDSAAYIRALEMRCFQKFSGQMANKTLRWGACTIYV